MAGLNIYRATGPWVCKNCRWCGSTSAPGFAEQVIVGLLSAGRPVSGPYEKEGPASRSAVGAGVLTRPPDFRQGAYKAVGAAFVVARREEIAPTCRGGTLGRPPSPGDSLVTFSSLRKSLAAGAAKFLQRKEYKKTSVESKAAHRPLKRAVCPLPGQPAQGQYPRGTRGGPLSAARFPA